VEEKSISVTINPFFDEQSRPDAMRTGIISTISPEEDGSTTVTLVAGDTGYHKPLQERANVPSVITIDNSHYLGGTKLSACITAEPGDSEYPEIWDVTIGAQIGEKSNTETDEVRQALKAIGAAACKALLSPFEDLKRGVTCVITQREAAEAAADHHDDIITSVESPSS